MSPQLIIAFGTAFAACVVALYFLVQWGKMVMFRNKKYDSICEAVRSDAVYAFLAHCHVKVETKKFSIFRVSSTQQLRQQERYHCSQIIKKMPDFDFLMANNVPLLLTNFLTKEELKFLTVVN